MLIITGCLVKIVNLVSVVITSRLNIVIRLVGGLGRLYAGSIGLINF